MDEETARETMANGWLRCRPLPMEDVCAAPFAWRVMNSGDARYPEGFIVVHDYQHYVTISGGDWYVAADRVVAVLPQWPLEGAKQCE